MERRRKKIARRLDVEGVLKHALEQISGKKTPAELQRLAEELERRLAGSEKLKINGSDRAAPAGAPPAARSDT